MDDDRGELASVRHSRDRRRDDPEDSNHRPERHASAWSDPRFWVSVTAVLLTIGIAVGGFLASELLSIHTTLNTILVNNSADSAKKTEQIGQLRHDLDDMKASLKKFQDDQTAYNFNLKADLVRAQERNAIAKER